MPELMQPEVTRDERLTLQSQPDVSPAPRGLTESSSDVQALSDGAFPAIYGARAAEARAAFNADVAQRGPDAALTQLAERPGAYAPGVEASSTSRALAGSLRLSVPDSDTRTPTAPNGQTRTPPDTQTNGLAVDDPPQVRSVGGVSTESVFPMGVGPEETQESVLRRSFQEYAFRAGISNQQVRADGESSYMEGSSPSGIFVEKRMDYNYTSNGGKYEIFNPKTGENYTTDEWTDIRNSRGIEMYPTDLDMVDLEYAYLETGLDNGARAAEKIIGLLDSIDGLSSSLLQQALQQAIQGVEANGHNAAFQAGFVNKLQVDGFIRLSEALENTPRNNAILSNALSSEAAYTRSSGGQIVANEVARTADPALLNRLTADPAHPMDSEFLAEAVKNVWSKSSMNTPDGRAVIERAAKDSKASLQLLQDPEFVRNMVGRTALLRREGESYASISMGLDLFIRSGLSPEMRDANPTQVANALRIVTEAIAQVQGTPVPGGGLIGRGNYDPMNASLASALTEAYVTNTAVFANAAGLKSERPGDLDGADIRTFLLALQPYGDRRDPQTGQTLNDQILAATAVEYTRRLNRAAETGNEGDATSAGNLAGAILDGISRADVASGRAADEQQEKLNQYISIAAEVLTFNKLKGTGEIVADILGKVAAAESGSRLKGNNVDRANSRSASAFDRQVDTNSVAVLSAVERASTSNRADRTPEQIAQDKQFVDNLKAYNDSLTDGKILDSSGRLIRLADTSDRQRSNMERLATNAKPGDASPELIKAMDEVNKRVDPLLGKVNGATVLQKSTTVQTDPR